MGMEMSDVITEAIAKFLSYAYIIPIVAIPFALAFYLIKNTYKNKSGTWILIGFLLLNCFRVYDSGTCKLNPNEGKFTIENSTNALFGYFLLKLMDSNAPHYEPYQIIALKKPESKEPINIVYIIGESVNYKHMSLFGYEHDTTPELKKLALENNVYYAQGVSAAVATIASVKLMLNIVREPDNIRQSSSSDTDLFRLAKQKGFKTFYFSAQVDDAIATVNASNYIDVSTKPEDFIGMDCRTKDEHLFEIFSKQKLTNKNFIVFHQRAIHSPYKNSVPKKHMSDSGFASDYDKAISYVDYLVSKIFNLFNKSEGKFYIIWASDHNELQGEEGSFGHGLLLPAVGDVPMLFQSNDSEFLREIKEICRPTHYEVGKSIANILGYEISNHNEKDNIFYINGVDYNGKCGHIKFQKDLKNKKLIYF